MCWVVWAPENTREALFDAPATSTEMAWGSPIWLKTGSEN